MAACSAGAVLWDFSSTGDGQTYIISTGGVPPILSVMRSAVGHDELQKKALSMLWNITISAAGISALVRSGGVAVVVEVMRSHAPSEEVQQNALGVLRNISDSTDGQVGAARETPRALCTAQAEPCTAHAARRTLPCAPPPAPRHLSVSHHPPLPLAI